jgi:PKD repeat protein
LHFILFIPNIVDEKINIHFTMKSTYKLILLSFLFCTSQINKGFAQNSFPCATDEAEQSFYLAHPEMLQSAQEYRDALTQRANEISSNRGASYTLRIVPIVFHILHVNGAENIPDADVIAQVNRLNIEYKKLNDMSPVPPYFSAQAGTLNIEFRLATIDPNGNCTNGIDRIYTHKTFNAHDGSKLNQWPRDKYLNVWVVSSIASGGVSGGTTLGYTYQPPTVAGAFFPNDGIMMVSFQCNGNGTTLTHEIGHWIGLDHTWGTTAVATVCGDDAVSDTPRTKGHFSTCPSYDFTCDSKALSITYDFSKVTTTTGNVDSTAVPTLVDPITMSRFKATGVSTNSSTANVFSYTKWNTGGLGINGNNNDTAYSLLGDTINMAKYYEFTVTPAASHGMSLTTLAFNFKRNLTGVRTFSVRSSIDGFKTNLTAKVDPASPSASALLKVKAGNIFYLAKDTIVDVTGAQITMSGTPYTGIRTPITFRIYGFNAEDSVGTFGIDNVNLVGTSGALENINNFMEYASCRYMFTEGQAARMRAGLESTVSSRSNLYITSNLIATGTNGGTVTPCAPKADFYVNRNTICPGNNVLYTTNILNLPGGATPTVLWSFPGGTPATSTAANPTVTYNLPGVYNATLKVTNGGKSDSITKTNSVVVSENYAQVSGLFAENFENTNEYFQHWYNADLDNNQKKWWLKLSNGYNSNNCLVMNANGNFEGDIDQLFTPSYDLTYVTNGSMTFKCAAATKATASADITDNLKIYSSTDCGATWIMRKSLSGTALLNNGFVAGDFAPTSTSQWVEQTVNIPSSLMTSNTRFKFEYTTGAMSNNIYIDDININGVLSVNENAIETANISIFPNPTSQTSTVSYHLNKKGNATIQLIDVLGKKIMEVNNMNQAEGDYSIQISKQELHLLNGIYFVKCTIDNSSVTKKLIISE